IADFKDILANHSRVLDIIKTDLLEIKERFGDERRTEIVEAGFDVEDEDLIPEENVIITITTNGYIKRNTTDTYRTQNRGGKGVKGISMHDDDIVSQVVTMSTHNHLLLFTNFGKVYRIKGYQVPQVNRTAKGTPIVNILTTLDKDEKIRSMVPIDPNADSKYLFFVTAKGLVKKVEQQEFDSIRQTGKIAITLREDDELFAVKQIGEGDEIVIAGSNGKAIRFMESDVRPMGRNASGVIGFNTDGSEVVGVTCRYEGEYLLAVTEKGYGKKTALDDYRLTQRGAKGVGTINITDKNGKLVSVKAVNGDEDLLIATTGGVVIRISLSNVSVYGRNTQGVRLINVEEGSTVSTIAVVEHDETEETIAVEIPMEETTEEQA
ncbi:MAG: DNA gyrase subunit A, partial [Erysipelotrichaceae bacterium]|nr:DNA gyrase subunit A [Erysipelotrichaceae bacterium]